MANSRNNTLDVLKLFASYMVVFIHIMFYGKVGAAFDALARFAVPFFFAVSGFYSYGCTPRQIRKRIAHILYLLLLAVSVYILWNVLDLLLRHDSQGLVQFFSRFLSITSLLKLFVFNVPLFTVHLWYLFGILYVYIVYYFVTLLKIRERFVFSAAILLLVLHILLGEVLSVFHIIVPVPILRNFALMGIPCFGLGLLANAYRHKLVGLPKYVIILLLAAGILETLISRFCFGKNELYLGSLFILSAIVIAFIQYPDTKYPPALLALTGCSTYIYILHPLVSAIIMKVYPAVHMHFDSSVSLQMIHPLLVCVFSTLLAYALNKLLSISRQKKES